MASYDIIVIGAGVIGSSVAFHLAELGARRVLLLDRGRIAEGTTAQSSGILRTHYSVPENVDLARRSWRVFERFADYLADDEASAGLVRCGYLIAAPEGARCVALAASLDAQAAMGIPVRRLSAADAAALLPIARFDDAALIGFEPEAGFADAHLVATSFARAARRRGVHIREGVAVQQLRRGASGAVIGVATDQGDVAAPLVISAQNIWATDIARWTGITLPVTAERHKVLALQGPQAYSRAMPVFKDLASPGMVYCRSYGGNQMLVSEGTAGEPLAAADTTPGAISDDDILAIAGQAAERFPSFAEAGVAASWTGVYDVTPDWNPVLGRLPEVPGLLLACGFSGHGFKLSPAIGRVLAQDALGLPTDVPLAPYALERFRSGRLLVGRYGSGAVS